MANNISGVGGIKVGDQRLPNSPKAEPASTPAAPATPGDGSVKLSDETSKIIKIASKLKHLPEIDEARVAHIRQAVEKGQYHVDPRRVAQKFLELERHLAAGAT